ncbi:MAG: trypsin-like peptidase domain-containing protein, partial [Pseudomonadota bacterium]
CLNEDAPSTLPLAPPPDKGDDLTVMGYGRPKVHLAHETSCKSLGRRGAGLMLDCPLRQGASGAPVIDPSGGVVGIVSRSGPSGTLATLVPADAAKVCEAPAPS